MTALIIPLPGSETLAVSLARKIDAEIAKMTYRRFPDGESYVRFLTSPEDREIIILARLARPDKHLSKLMFTAAGARSLGARRTGLIAPYLPYMRQDKRFNPGEVITSSAFANFVSAHFDWLMTVDPHLHRRAALSEIYTIPSTRLQAAPLLATWIKAHVTHPVLIGPDSESEQWVSEAARAIDCPYRILAKTRRGDRDVDIQLPDLSGFASARPVILDDTISTAHTMIEATRQIAEQGLKAPVCCAVHGVYDAIALAALQDAGPAQIVTTNTLECETASIDISPLLADALMDQGF